MIKEEFAMECIYLSEAVCPSCGSFDFEISIEEGEIHGYCNDCEKGFRFDISIRGILDVEDMDYMDISTYG